MSSEDRPYTAFRRRRSDEKNKSTLRYLIDSALMRQLMREIINSHPDMTVVDVAPIRMLRVI